MCPNAKWAVGDGIPLEFVSAPISLAEIDRSAKDLFDTRSEWSPDPSQVYYTYPDVETATIHVGIGEDIAQISLPLADRSTSGRALRIEYSVEPSGLVEEAGSRISDSGGWTGGNWMSSSQNLVATATNSGCTLGFTWRMWDDSSLVGGTAQHCIEPNSDNCIDTGDRYAIWYHNTRTMGISVRESEATDSALLVPASHTSFNASVWVGGAATSVERIVVAGAPLDAVDNVVALSASRHGPPETVTAVYQTNVNTCAGTKTATDDYVGRGGDSGGPWLTTYSNGTVRAHGQHYGRGVIDGLTRSLYTPVVRASAALEASIAVVP